MAPSPHDTWSDLQKDADEEQRLRSRQQQIFEATPQPRLPYMRLRPKDGGNIWCYCEVATLSDVLDGKSPDEYEIERVHLTLDEWLALPEFVGW